MGKTSNITSNQMRILQDQFKTDREIASHINVTPQYVRILRERFGMKIVRVLDVKSVRNYRIYWIYKNGMNMKTLSENFSVSLTTIKTIIRRCKHELNERSGIS